MITLSLAVENYFCKECAARGIDSRELVRMIPRAAVMNGKLVGDEWWCCPECHERKFQITGEKVKKSPRRRQIKCEADAKSKRAGMRVV